MPNINLMSDEEIVWETSPHWLGQIGWYVRKSPWALVPAAVAAALGYFGVIAWLPASAVIALALGLWLGIGYLIRRMTRYIVTTHRARKAWGVFSRQSDEARLTRIQNIAVDQSFIQRLFRLGHVDLDTAGEISQEMLRMHYVRRPEEVRALIAHSIEQADRNAMRPYTA